MRSIKQLANSATQYHCMTYLFSCLFVRFENVADDPVCGLYMPLARQCSHNFDAAAVHALNVLQLGLQLFPQKKKVFNFSYQPKRPNFSHCHPLHVKLNKVQRRPILVKMNRMCDQ
jgi:hypothetical protein